MHAYVLWAAWGVVIFVMCVTNLWYSYKSDQLQRVHSITGYAILVLTIFGIGAYIQAIGIEIGGFHTLLGLGTLILNIALALGGVISYKAKQ